MLKSVLIGSAALLSIAAAPAFAQVVVNVDGLTNASTDGSNSVSQALNAGTYNLSFTQGSFTAFSRFSGSGGCDVNGANCQTGFENSVRYVIDGQTFLFGDGSASGGLGPVSGGAYYDTAANSFANSGKYTTTFTLTAPTNVGFYLFDDNLSDNRGGVSLAVAAVPEPATWAMMVLGFGMVGFGFRARRKVSTKVSFA